MSLQKLINNSAAFNSWANSQFVEWLQTIDEDVLYKQIPSSFTSIDYTIQHILRIQKFWLAFICQDDVSKFDWSIIENRVKDVFIDLRKQSEDMRIHISTFSENQLNQMLELDMPWAKNKLSRYEYIIHVMNHSTFHRGQIITIARGLGITENIPATDYNIFNCQ